MRSKNREAILGSFGLSRNFKHRAEAMAMCLYEYNEEKHMEMERREHYQRGLADGQRHAKREIILHMLSQNQTPEAISELTGEPLSYIEELNSSDK